ncbi:hypothetical protein [Spiroplasma poulsonii]|uniref:hypothetical protein n=1 Tax=Spiroplasma poulsonii TaxID=2138 RepID=UPI003A5C7C2A
MIKLLLLMLPKLQSNAQKKRQKQSYSGKKKKHTIKTQVIIEQETKKIIATSFSLARKKNMIMLYLKNQKSQF